MRNGLFFLALIALELSACSSSISPLVGGAQPHGADAAALGAELFNSNCAVCHGPAGHGDGPAANALEPKPKNLAEFAPTISDDELFWRITTGKPGTAMVSWKGVLSDEQIWQVVAYIRTLK